jgi:phosphate transport system substrate-binding protein
MNAKLYKLFAVLIVLTMALAACGTPTTTNSSVATEVPANAPAEEQLSGTISVSGAFALYPMMTVWADEFHKLHPDVEFDVQGGGAGKSSGHRHDLP